MIASEKTTSKPTMKPFRFLDKVIFLLNTAFALLLLFSYALPYVFPKQFPLISVLSLTLPILIMINIVFLLYWLIQLKKQWLLSFFILLLGYKHIGSLYKFSGNTTITGRHNSMSVMTYNVRLFNAYGWIDDEAVGDHIVDLIRKSSPDIVCIQEFHLDKEAAFAHYPYQYIENKIPNQKNGQAIFSRFPIVHKGSLAFPETSNNAIYADIVKGKDTMRIYNLHLESLRIRPEVTPLTQENSKWMYRRIGKAFVMQQSQVELFMAHQQNCHYKKIICGDFNNTQYSNIYRRLKKGMKDSFEEAGKGFGRTFDFNYFPMRIDFILADENIEIQAHKNYSIPYSDHFPVQAMLTF